MEIASLDELKETFINRGGFPFPEEMMVNGIKYKTNKTSSYSVKDMITKGHKAVWVYYTPYREQSHEAGLDHAIVFLWGFIPEKHMMVPYDVRTMSKARLEGGGPITEKIDNGDSVTINKDRIVGDVVDVIVTSIPNSTPLKGKVDTGADVSSIHAESWKVENGQVTFDCPELSVNRITLPVLEKQAIKSSNGDMEYRPVIELNIKINNQQLTNCMFNLNDRGTMSYPVLVGQNILEAGGFMVDPSIDDPDKLEEDFEIDWESLQEEFKDDVVSDVLESTRTELIEKMIDFLKLPDKK